MSLFNSNLPYIRKQKGVSQSELANKVGVDQSTISLWEKGMDTTVENAIKVAEVLNVPIPDFFGKDLRFDSDELVDLQENIVKIPVYGTIKAGTPIEAQQDILEYVDIPEEWTKGGKIYYGLKIIGDSMFPKYQTDDIVIFEQTNDMTIANGKDCAIMVNGFDATFKNVRINPSGIQLIPLNMNNSDGFEPTFYDSEEIQKLPIKIIGIAREKRTKL